MNLGAQRLRLRVQEAVRIRARLSSLFTRPWAIKTATAIKTGDHGTFELLLSALPEALGFG